MKFVLCSGCDRHVSDTETQCPFCGAEAFRRAPTRTRGRPRGRLLVAGLAATITACGESEPSVDGAVIDSGHQHPTDASAPEAAVDAAIEADADLEASIPIYDAVPPMPDPEE